MKTIQLNNFVYNEKQSETINNVPDFIEKGQYGRIACFVAACKKLDYNVENIVFNVVENDKNDRIYTMTNGNLFDSINIDTRCSILKYNGKRIHYKDILKANGKETENEPNENSTTANTEQQEEQQPTEPTVAKYSDMAVFIADNYDIINTMSRITADDKIFFVDPVEVDAVGLKQNYISVSDFEAAELLNKERIEKAIEEEKRREEAERIAKEEAEKREEEARIAAEKNKGLRPEAIKALSLAMAAKKSGRGLAVYMYGPAGTGKSTMIESIAQKLELPFYQQSQVFNEFELFGYVDANGNFQQTAFYKAFTEGGVFCLDEMDCSDPCTLKKLNSAIANNKYCFQGVGMKTAHENFYVFATGNTLCRPDADYSAAQLIDVSTVDRFFTLKIGYSEELENEIAIKGGHKECAEFVIDLRNSAKEIKTNFVSSLRLLNKLLTYKDIEKSNEEALTDLVKNFVDDNTLCALYNNLSDKNSEYAKAMYAIL